MNTESDINKQDEKCEKSEKGKLSKADMKELLAMKNLTVGEFINQLKNHPTLHFLLTTAGVWLLVQIVFSLFVAVNVLYAVGRVFRLVLG